MMALDKKPPIGQLVADDEEFAAYIMGGGSAIRHHKGDWYFVPNKMMMGLPLKAIKRMVKNRSLYYEP